MAGEIVINGWLSKVIAGIATAGVLGGFAGLLTAQSLAQDYKNHKETETAKIQEMKARQDKLWDEQIADRTNTTVIIREVERAKDRQDRIEQKINKLLIKQGINPDTIESGD